MKQKKWIILFCTAVGTVLAGLLGWQVYRDWFSYNEHPDLSNKINMAEAPYDVYIPESWEYYLREDSIEGIYIGEVQELLDEPSTQTFKNNRAAFQITDVVAEGSLHLQPGDVIEIGFSDFWIEIMGLEEFEFFNPGDRILGLFAYVDTYWQGKKEKFYGFYGGPEGVYYLDAGDRLRSLSASPLASKYDGLPKQRLINDLKKQEALRPLFEGESAGQAQ